MVGAYPAVTVAATTSVTLTWTAPGDDGTSGRATAYDLRYLTQPITGSNWITATKVTSVPTPATAGTTQTVTIPGLTVGTAYYFAIATRDEAGNWSAISNVVRYPSLTTGVDDASPAAVSCSTPWPNPARDRSHVALALPEGTDVQADVFDVDGRHVRTVTSGWHAAGRSDLDWDLRDQAGGSVASGIYLMRVKAGTNAWTRRITVVR